MGDIVSSLRVMLDGLAVLIEHVSQSLPAGDSECLRTKLADLEARVSTLEGKLQ